MTANPEVLSRAVEVMHAAEAVVIMAGAGMGVDSGFPSASEQEGWWRMYPFSGEQKAATSAAPGPASSGPAWFADDPALAWGFFGQRLELCRNTAPHAGFEILRRWAVAKPEGYFVFTANVDGHFQKAGFAEERMLECHGALQHLQCIQPCCAATWPAPADLHIELDAVTRRAQGELPRCIRCGGYARPNVLLFGDETWSPARTAAQQVRYRAWQRSLARGKFVVIELGAGFAAPTVRQAAEQLATAGRVPLVRINPHETGAAPQVIFIADGIQAALQGMDALMS